jgi:hypothetical protein
MLTLLLNPFVRKLTIGIACAIACMAAYSFWAAHMRAAGAAAEKLKEEAVAIQHEQEVTSEATAVDQAVSQDSDPQDTLQKNWSQP